MKTKKIIIEADEWTLVDDFTPSTSKKTSFQSEAQLESELIKQLQDQKYEYLNIHNNEDLVKNLRIQIENLNNCKFNDSEWKTFFQQEIIKKTDYNYNYYETKTIQEDYIKTFSFENGHQANIKLIDKEDIHNNKLQVINQYETKGKYENRYDVTILVNGFPLVHIELKRRGIPIREAFNQINRYHRESFWSDESSLFRYIQIFVISNGTNTKYYSNTTRYNFLESQTIKNPKATSSNSFEFTSFWADKKNKTITDLFDFTKTFFAKHTILNILTKYCVFTVNNKLLIMRPYQIAATEAIINKIKLAKNYKEYGTDKSGGFIWHSTGSGKTLTSFKTAILATKLKDNNGNKSIKKVLFVVDRKDLDYQTMLEYDKFQKGAANSNSSTKILKTQLEDDGAQIVITTIQKLSNFIKKYPRHKVYNDEVVIIFDECHRSQFGDMHKAIKSNFKKYYMFGFTGTPILEANAAGSGGIKIWTTQKLFGPKLHSYTVLNAIEDKNVLPFKVEYVNTVKEKSEIDEKYVQDIDKEAVLLNPVRISNIVSYIIEHFDQKTYRSKSYKYSITTKAQTKQEQYVKGFNSIFAVASIEAAKKYYEEFKKQQKDLPQEKQLKVGLIYSYAPNEEVNNQVLSEENSESTNDLDISSRDFLSNAILDYNKMFNCNFDTTGDKFQNYYKDISLRMKNKELDLLIVVNMFLTGFDATTLNTLWLDKNLWMHGLIQAFSRTNRILNSIKTYGNIISFRRIEKRVKDAIALFSDEKALGLALIKTFEEYYNGYTDEEGNYKEGYLDIINTLQEKFSLDKWPIVSEQEQKDFIKWFNAYLNMKNLLATFDKFQGKEILSERDHQDYLSYYQDIKDEWKKKLDSNPKESILDDIIFEMELVKEHDIDVDFIMNNLAEYYEKAKDPKEIDVSDIFKSIERLLNASTELRNKKDLIKEFIAELNSNKYEESLDYKQILELWNEYISRNLEKELDTITKEENLNYEKTYSLVKDCFELGPSKLLYGDDVNQIFNNRSRFSKQIVNIKTRKELVIPKLLDLIEKYKDTM